MENEVIRAAALIAGGIALGFSGLGVGLGQGIAAGRTAEAVGRNPEAEDKIRSTMFIGLGIAESAVIYGLVFALMMIFVVQS